MEAKKPEAKAAATKAAPPAPDPAAFTISTTAEGETPNLTRDSIALTIYGKQIEAGKSEADAMVYAKKRAREMVP
jgi:hypothetical protein